MDIDKIKASKSMDELINFGVVNIDKPTGPSSFWTSQFVKRKLGLSKTSHMGTLDPMVTGVLPVTLGRACKLADYFMHRNKVYVGIMRLHEDVSDERLAKVMKEFIGKITQLPPVKSRVKRAEREREIKSFDILERDGKDVLFVSDVQAGTYIRKLIHDIGLQVGGAHMLELRRTRAGLFDEEKMYTLYEFEKAVEEYEKGNEKDLREMIWPGEIVSKLLPVVKIKEDFVEKCLTGSPVFVDFVKSGGDGLEEGEKICLFEGDRFIGCYNYIGKNGLFAKSEFVFN